MVQIHNESDYVFEDVSSEKVRVYHFGDERVEIDEPEYLAVSDSGHRVLDAAGVSHYIPYGWKHLSWETHDDEPHFVK